MKHKALAGRAILCGLREPDDEIAAALSRTIIGQPEAVKAILPFVDMYHAGLSPEGRPAGVFLLLGPTGTGKTRTVEALAEALHGSDRHLLRVDCAEYQMEHEVAKLIGAPPGYLGHRETHPLLTQLRLNAVTSENSNLSIVLFDEIEKAAPSLDRLLLGVLDKGSLRLGDNSTVSFERSIIFLTSNLGAREMERQIRPGFGFHVNACDRGDLARTLKTVSLAAARRRYPPEFLNRVDALITYQPLGEESLAGILDQQLIELQRHIQRRLNLQDFGFAVSAGGRRFLLQQGVSAGRGARELKRTIQRHLMQPLARLFLDGEIGPGSAVDVDAAEEKDRLKFAVHTPGRKRLRRARR